MRQMLEKDKVGVDDVSDFLGGLSAEGLAELSSKGCRLQYVLARPRAALYVPAGYFVFEYAKKGVLIYGCRWSAVVRSPSQSASYDELIGMNGNSGKHVDKMKKAWESLGPTEDES